jgi:hypothetical protein
LSQAIRVSVTLEAKAEELNPRTTATSVTVVAIWMGFGIETSIEICAQRTLHGTIAL